MADKIGARKNGNFKAVSTAPCINKTPIGPSTPPVPYPVCQDLSSSIGVATTVFFNGDPAYLLNQTTQPSCIGDAPGTAGGIKSGTVSSEVKPVNASTTVNACHKSVVREMDACTLNKGNCPGIYVTQPAPGGSISNGQPVSSEKDPTPETQKETEAAKEKKGFWKALWEQKKHEVSEAFHHPVDAVIGAAKGIANIPSELTEMVAKGSTLESASDMEQSAAMQRLFGQTQQAEELESTAQQVREGAKDINIPKFQMSNDAQAGGDTIATVVSVVAGGVGFAKSGVKAVAGLGRAEGALVKGEGALGKAEATIAKTEAALSQSDTALAESERVMARGESKIAQTAKPTEEVSQAPNAEDPERNTGITVNGQPKGGSYGKLKKLYKNQGKEIHHIPADSQSPLPKNDGPAIAMDAADHRKTASYDNLAGAKEYMAKQGELINEGKFREAMEMDIADIKSKFGTKYDSAITQAVDYAKSIGKW